MEIGLGRALGVGVGCVSSRRFVGIGKARGKGLACRFCGSFPPASEREARMDDPTLRCENDTGNETRLSGLSIPSDSPILFES